MWNVDKTEFEEFKKEIEASEHLALDEYEDNIVYSTKMCPICSLGFIRDSTLVEYLLKTHGMDRMKSEQIMRDRFGNSLKSVYVWLKE